MSGVELAGVESMKQVKVSDRYIGGTLTVTGGGKA